MTIPRSDDHPSTPREQALAALRAAESEQRRNQVGVNDLDAALAAALTRASAAHQRTAAAADLSAAVAAQADSATAEKEADALELLLGRRRRELQRAVATVQTARASYQDVTTDQPRFLEQQIAAATAAIASARGALEQAELTLSARRRAVEQAELTLNRLRAGLAALLGEAVKDD